MKTPYDKLVKIDAKYFGHMTKMAATPIYGKNALKFSPEPGADDLGTWNVALWMWSLPSWFK